MKKAKMNAKVIINLINILFDLKFFLLINENTPTQIYQFSIIFIKICIHFIY